MGEGGGGDAEDPQDALVEPCKKSYRVKAGRDGALAVPPEVAATLGLEPGAEVELVVKNGLAEIRPNIHSLSRVYIEPTSRCNLACRTCIRNTWKEPLGDMEAATFDRLAGQLRRFPHLQSAMFGGFGEPTMHPDILRMVRGMKALGVKTELVTNGTLLDDAMLAGLMESRLDTLWVSFDGGSEAGFEDIRSGAGFRDIVASLQRLKALNRPGPHRIAVGIAFVVMKKNIGELQHLDRLIRLTGASAVLVSNVLPYSAEMEKEMVYSVALSLETFAPTPGRAEINLPRLDVNELTRDAVFSLLKGQGSLNLMGTPLHTETKSCRFIRGRCTFIRWDGKVSPCMGLLHNHTAYLYRTERAIKAYAVGNIKENDLFDIWGSREYREFRDKIDAFDFSPCHICGGCSDIDANKTDCSGSAFPACGGCLWAQGVIQCP